MIMITDVDMFDYSAGEPAPEVLTVLRALEVASFSLVTLYDELTICFPRFRTPSLAVV